MTIISKTLILIAWGSFTALGQSISFANPGVVSGTAVPLPCTITSITTLATVEWQIDGERQLIVPAVQSNLCPAGTLNSYYTSNGNQHTLVAIARDGKQNVLATSSSATFSVENSLPQQTSPATDITAANGPAPYMTLGTCPSGCSSFGMNVMALKTTGTSTVTSVIAPLSTLSAGASLSSGTFSDSAGQALVVFATWYTTGTTITCSNTGGDTWQYATSQSAGGGGYYAQWCYALNIHGSASDNVTITYSNSQSGNRDSLYVFKATNVATSSALDTQLNSSGGATQALPMTGMTQGGDTVFYGLAHAGTTASSTASNGYTGVAPASNAISSVEYAQMPSSLSSWRGQWGFQITTNGPLATSSAKVLTLFVDGQEPTTANPVSGGSSGSANPLYTTFATDNFSNALHQVLIREDGPNCSGCINGSWTDMGTWEQSITFANPVIPAQLILSAREAFLCVSGTSTCHYPTSYTITGSYLNTDGSTTATTVTCGAPSTGAVTQSSCTFTAASAGIANITATAPNGMTRTDYLMVEPQDGLPHFSSSGGVLTVFSKANSILRQSIFGTSSVLTGPSVNLYPNPKAANDYKGAGFNTVETSGPSGGTGPPGIGVSEATFEAAARSDAATICGGAATYGLKVHLIGDVWSRGSNELGTTMLGPGNPLSPIGSSYTTPAFQYWLSQYLTCTIAIDMVDEVTSSWGGIPLQAVNQSLSPGNGGGLTSLTMSGTTATATCSTCSFNGSFHFIVTGDTSPCASSLNYNATTNANNFQSSGNGNFTFTVPSCTGSASSSAVVHPYVNYTFDATLKSCSPGTGGSSGPCPYYIPDTAFYTLRKWQQAAGGPLMGWPPRSGSSGIVVQQWCGQSTAGSPALALADFCTFYDTISISKYHPAHIPLSDLQAEQLSAIRNNYYPYLNFANALISETNGVPVTYALVGYPAAIASCSGDTITFSSDHGLRNVLPGDTRVTITGSSGGNCDGKFYVWSIPDSTHMRVNLRFSTFTATPTTGTLTWQDGSTTPVSSLNSLRANSTDYSQTSLSPNAINLSAKRGMTFTTAGSGTSFDTTTFSYGWDVNDYAAGGVGINSGRIRQMANFTASTGGTAYILPNNAYVRGPQNWANNSDEGPQHMFASQTTPYLLRVSGKRQYQSSLSGGILFSDPYDRAQPTSGTYPATNFNNSFPTLGSCIDLGGVSPTCGGIQGAINPQWDYAQTYTAWVATANATLLMNYLANSGFLLQPSLNSPDYGLFFEAAARTSIVTGVNPQYGNLLMLQSYADNTVSCTANLGPYLISGQPIYRYYATWSGIQFATLTAGTASDTMTCEPGALRVYVFPNSGQYTPSTPTLSVRLGDVSNASDVLIQYSYSPLAWTTGVASYAFVQTFDCVGGSCVLPVDRNIGPVYYKILYVNSSGAVLATSDMQSL